MQMQVGVFRFEAGGAEYQKLTRRLARRWEERPRHGLTPELEDTGRAAEVIEISGVVPVWSADHLAALEELAEVASLRSDEDAKPVPVFLGGGDGSSGQYLGMFAIAALEWTERSLRFNGIPTEIDFSVALKEFDRT